MRHYYTTENFGGALQFSLDQLLEEGENPATGISTDTAAATIAEKLSEEFGATISKTDLIFLRTE